MFCRLHLFGTNQLHYENNNCHPLDEWKRYNIYRRKDISILLDIHYSHNTFLHLRLFGKYDTWHNWDNFFYQNKCH